MGVIGFPKWVLMGAVLCTPILLTSSMALATNASYPPKAVCDPNYMTTLQDRAKAEIQRELEVNNAVITKPNSVLALSCFDTAMTAAAKGGAVFSDRNNADVPLQDAINAAVGDSLSNFYIDNFVEDGDPGIGFFAGSNSSSCGRLMGMWNLIKYSVTQPGYVQSLDYFRADAAGGNDMRGSDNSMASTMATTYKTGLEISTDLEAGNDKYTDQNNPYFSVARPDFCSYDPKSGGSGTALNDNKICTVENSGDKKCSDMPAIPTGVALTYSASTSGTSDQVWAYTCLNPGCYFDAQANLNSIKVSGNSTPPTNMKCSARPSS